MRVRRRIREALTYEYIKKDGSELEVSVACSGGRIAHVPCIACHVPQVGSWAPTNIAILVTVEFWKMSSVEVG